MATCIDACHWIRRHLEDNLSRRCKVLTYLTDYESGLAVGVVGVYQSNQGHVRPAKYLIDIREILGGRDPDFRMGDILLDDLTEQWRQKD